MKNPEAASEGGNKNGHSIDTRIAVSTTTFTINRKGMNAAQLVACCLFNKII